MKIVDTIREKLTRLGALKLLITYTAIIHAGLFAYDIFHPDVFLNADRADQRLEIINLLIAWATSGADLSPLLSEPGIIGDYIVQTVLYGVVGQYGVIVFQVALLLVSVAALFQLALLVCRSRVIASITVLLYIHLPHTLVFPHQLISEAIFNPLIILSSFSE